MFFFIGVFHVQWKDWFLFSPNFIVFLDENNRLDNIFIRRIFFILEIFLSFISKMNGSYKEKKREFPFWQRNSMENMNK
jgi:hypothetical protein